VTDDVLPPPILDATDRDLIRAAGPTPHRITWRPVWPGLFVADGFHGPAFLVRRDGQWEVWAIDHGSGGRARRVSPAWQYDTIDKAKTCASRLWCMRPRWTP